MCRSPLAEGYLKKLLQQKGIGGVEVRSAALFYEFGYPATDGAQRTARENGFNLDHHTSHFMDESLFDWADEVLVMATEHKQRIEAMFGAEAARKVFLLGSFDPEYRKGELGSSPEIHDPYGGGKEDYHTVFTQIKRCIDAWSRQKLN